MDKDRQNLNMDPSPGTFDRETDRQRTITNRATDAESGAADTTVQLESVTGASGARIHEVNTPVVVQLREEELGANKEWVEAGAVLVRKQIETSTETLPVQVGYEEVQVDRVAVNRILEENEKAEPRQEGNTWIVPVIEEELVVMKRRVVRDELRITKQVKTREEQVSGEVKKERLNIETTGNLSQGKG